VYTNLEAIVQEDGRIRLSGPCVVTGLEYSVVVSREGALAYFEGGVTAREAFPELPKEEREFLISGTSPSGWRKLFDGAEESQEDPADRLDVEGGGDQ
jgi:hypothetical protein